MDDAAWAALPFSLSTVDNITAYCYDVNSNVNNGVKKMKTKEAIDYFGDIKRLAAALDMWPHSIYRWGDTVPLQRQYELQVKTKGALVASTQKDKK